MSEQIMISVHIPCKGYIKKYLIERYGEHHMMNKNSLFGSFIFLNKKCPKPNIQLTKYNQKYDVLIPAYYLTTLDFEIGYKKIHYLALCFEKIFFEDLMQNIDLAVSKYHVKPIDAMRKFLNKYNINENDMKFDSIYRQYQREKSKKKIIKK